MTGLLQDLRLAIRSLGRRPGFAGLAVSTLAAGVWVVVTVAAILNAYLLRSLPYPGAERLTDIRFAAPGTTPPRGLESLDWSQVKSIEHAIAWDLDMFFLTGGDHPEAAPGAWVTPGFLRGLGITPALGRLFDEEEFLPGGPQAVLVSDALWRRRFGADPAAVGRSFTAYVSDRPDEAETFTIVGVLPPDFWHVNHYTQVLAPLRGPSYPYMARLRPGVRTADVEREIGQLVREGLPGAPADWRVTVQSTHARYVAGVRPVLLAALGAAVLVLLVACANVSFLLLVRAVGRQREVAVRLALGASRWRVARILAAEALLLGGASTLLALLFLGLGLESIAPAVESQLGNRVPGGVASVRVDGTVLSFALAALCVTVLFGLVPLLGARRAALADALRSAGRSSTDNARTARLRSAFVAAEVAGCVTLLAGSMLMLRSTAKLMAVDLGVGPENVLTAHVGLRQRSCPDARSSAAFADAWLSALERIPGVRGAALASGFVLQPRRPSRLEVDAGPALDVGVHRVSPGYHATLNIPVIRGRALAPSDLAGAEPVVVVSESVARALERDGAPLLGRRIRILERDGNGHALTGGAWRTVVAVVGDVRQGRRDTDSLDVYVPLAQAPDRFFAVYVATAGAPAGWLEPVRRSLRDLDAEIALDAAAPLELSVEAELVQPKAMTQLLGAIAVFAVGLALVGVAGTVAFTVQQREREIAIRMALGASAHAVVGLFVRQGARILIAGLVIGTAGALAIGRSLRSQLYGVATTDGLTLVVTLALVALAGLLAARAAARRAARAEPKLVLREE